MLTGNSGGGYDEYQTCQVDQQQQRNHQKKLSEASRSYSTGKLSKLDGIHLIVFVSIAKAAKQLNILTSPRT